MREEKQRRLNEALERLKAINFYVPERSLVEANLIVPEVDRTIESVIAAWKPWKESRSIREAWKALYEEVDKAGRLKEYFEAYDAGNAVTRNSAYISEYGIHVIPRDDIGDYAALELMIDVPGFENNPVDPFIKLYEMGLKPLDFVMVDGREEYVVDFPLNINGRRMLGCKRSLW